MKYKELHYDECYWEFESDIATFQPEIEKFNRIQSRSRRVSRQKCSDSDSKKRLKEFQQYEHSPEFLSGGASFYLIVFLYFLQSGMFIYGLFGLIVLS